MQRKAVLCNLIRENTAKNSKAKHNKDPTAAMKAKVTGVVFGGCERPQIEQLILALCCLLKKDKG